MACTTQQGYRVTPGVSSKGTLPSSPSPAAMILGAEVSCGEKHIWRQTGGGLIPSCSFLCSSFSWLNPVSIFDSTFNPKSSAAGWDGRPIFDV